MNKKQLIILMSLLMGSCSLSNPGNSIPLTDSSTFSSKEEEEVSSSSEESIPESYKTLFDFTNVTIKVEEEDNVWLVKQIDKENIYKVDNLVPSKTTYDAVKWAFDYSSRYKEFEGSESYYFAENVSLYGEDGKEFAKGNIHLNISGGKLSSTRMEWQEEGKDKMIQASYYDYGTTVLNKDYSSIPASWKALFTFDNVTIHYEQQSSSSFLKANYKIHQVSPTELYKEEGTLIKKIDPDDYEPVYEIFMLNHDKFVSQETSNPRNQFYKAETIAIPGDDYPYTNAKVTVWDEKISIIEFERNIATGLYYTGRISFMNYGSTTNPSAN